jgi:hypothetical protein
LLLRKVYGGGGVLYELPESRIELILGVGHLPEHLLGIFRFPVYDHHFAYWRTLKLHYLLGDAQVSAGLGVGILKRVRA